MSDWILPLQARHDCLLLCRGDRSWGVLVRAHQAISSLNEVKKLSDKMDEFTTMKYVSKRKESTKNQKKNHSSLLKGIHDIENSMHSAMIGSIKLANFF